MWEFATGNTFGATGTLSEFYVFNSYFSMKYLRNSIHFVRCFLAVLCYLLIPSSGVADAYKASPDPANEVGAIAIYLNSWMIVTFFFLYVACLFSHVLA
jgi:succinate-acetate transporter protein